MCIICDGHIFKLKASRGVLSGVSTGGGARDVRRIGKQTGRALQTTCRVPNAGVEREISTFFAQDLVP